MTVLDLYEAAVRRAEHPDLYDYIEVLAAQSFLRSVKREAAAITREIYGRGNA